MGLFSNYKARKNRIEYSQMGMCPHCRQSILVDIGEDSAHCNACNISFERDCALQVYATYCADMEATIESGEKGLLKARKRSKKLKEFYDGEKATLTRMQTNSKTKLFVKSFWSLILAALLALTALICLLPSSSDNDVERQTDVDNNVVEALTPEPTQTPEPEESLPPEVIPEDSTFEIYFLDVDQGDAAVVLCDGKAMLIDGGTNKQSSLIYSFLKSHGINHLDYIVASHPDADHVGGLSGALNYATVDTAFCTTTEHDTETFRDFVRYLSKRNVEITVPDAGDRYTLGHAEFTILYPEAGATLSDNTSLIIRITYGDTSFLFTGDSETPDEKALMNSYSDIKTTVLKVGHHGSNSSSCYQFIYEVEPEYAVISVGGTNSYGHPSEPVLSRLHDADVITYRTDMHGDIHCTSDGQTVSFDTEKQPDIDAFAIAGGYGTWKAAQAKPTSTPTPSPQNQTTSSGTTYVLNTNTGKFHYPGCSSVSRMNEGNKEYFTGTREEIIAMGFDPCGRCHP